MTTLIATLTEQITNQSAQVPAMYGRVDFSRTMIFLTSNLGSHEVMNLMTGGLGFAANRSEEDEELVEQCMEVIRQTNRASVSVLQRRLRIGYTRAARIMDLLEERGVVGPNKGAEPREILIDLDGQVPTERQ